MAVRVDARCAFSCASLERTASSALPTNTVVSLPFPFPFLSRLPWVLSVFLSLHCLCEFQKKKKTRGAILLSFSTFLAPNNPLIIIVFFSVFLTNGSAPPLISTSLIPTTNRISAKKCKSKSIDEAGVH